jgi:serine/threonine protein kinase/Tol biopolymer transport system component
MIGTTVSHYRILSLLGRGGMGVVYKAEDIRLGRLAALKFLPETFAKDDVALERFRREARAASSINHPYICTIYDLGDHEGQPFIAMELLLGRPLKELIQGKKLTMPNVIDYSIQIVEALQAAHNSGILHRDIKPANIFITESGHVKLLDFGLARRISIPEDDATIPIDDLTKPGTLIGTVSYMSPEQARGDDLDARSDLFSFGVVLYEMITGRQPFPGTTLAGVFDKILHYDPPAPASLNSAVSPQLQELTLKLLKKNREQRYGSGSETLAALHGLNQTPAATPALARPRTVAPILLTVVLAVAAVVWLMMRDRQPATGLPSNLAFQQLTTDPGEELFPSLSPDAKSVAFAGQGIGNWDIYLQRIGGQPIDLTKDALADDTQPAFSPDGEHIVFRSERQGGGLFIMGATGESVRRVTNYGYNPVWSPDGTEILFATEKIVDNPNSRLGTSQLWVANVTTGATRLISKGDAVQPTWSSVGRIAYWAETGGQRDIWTIAGDGTDAMRVTNDADLDWNPVWSPDGTYLYFCSDRGGTTNIWRTPMNPKSGRATGPPQAVTTGGVGSRHHFSISKDGKHLAYVEAQVRLNLEKIRFNPEGETVEGDPVAITQGVRMDSLPTPSPDGEWLAFSSAGKQEDIYVIRSDGTGLRQITDDVFKDRLPRWSPDGQHIAFYSNRRGDYSIWTIKPDGSDLQPLTNPLSVPPYPVWSPDASQLAFRNSKDGSAILPLTTSGIPGEPRALPRLDASELFQVWSWSPDGKWLAGERVSTGMENLRGLAIFSIADNKFEKLLDYGAAPIWLSDNRRLLFWSQNKIQILDRVTKQTHDVMSASPKAIDVTFSMSTDNRILYFSSITREADVWMLTIGNN